MKIRARWPLGAFLFVWLAAALLAAQPVRAGTVINVTSTLDVLDGTDGKCTLREAISAVNTQSPSGGVAGECPAGTGGDTINLVSGTYVLATRGFSLTKDVTIAGASALINANGAVTHDRAFDIGQNAHVTLSHLTIENGQPADNGGGIRAAGWLTLSEVSLVNNSAANGGGLAVASPGEAVLVNVTAQNNHASISGGGIVYDGGAEPVVWDNLAVQFNSAPTGGGMVLNHFGALAIRHASVLFNQAAGDGGGILSDSSPTFADLNLRYNQAGNRGAGLMAYNSLTLTNALVQQNSISTTTNFGGGGGIYLRKVSLVNLDHVSIVSNTAPYGGGIYNEGYGNAVENLKSLTINANRAITEGGGIYNTSPLNLTNVTLSDNWTAVDAISGQYGGAIYHKAGSMLILNSTLAENFAGFFNIGASVYVTNSATLQIENSIVAASGGYTCFGTVTSLGHNLDQSANFCHFTASGDISGQNPKLGNLLSNGGLLQTRALLPGSPAIDHGDNTNCPALDARDIPRPIDGDRNGSKICDMGAYEAGPELYLPLIRR